MQLFIRIKDGQPFEHPIFEDNFQAAFPEIDLGNLPAEFARFVRVAPPAVGVYEIYEGVSYALRADGAYTDVHQVRPMTDEEITAKQDLVKVNWVAANLGYDSWNFSEALCSYVAPVPKPEDGNTYVWRESDLSWVFVPEPPKGDGWTFNVETGLWVKA